MPRPSQTYRRPSPDKKGPIAAAEGRAETHARHVCNSSFQAFADNFATECSAYPRVYISAQFLCTGQKGSSQMLSLGHPACQTKYVPAA